jgi:hypothetical protein
VDNIVPGIFSALQQNQLPGQTPTPQQVQQAYQQAAVMKGQGLTTEPVHAWTQGVNQMLKALLGNYQGYRADQLQRQLNAAQAGAIPGAAPYMPPPIPQTTNAPASTWGAGVPFPNSPFSAGGG